MAAPLAAALVYAGEGIPVLPLHTPRGDGLCSCRRECDRPGKHPRWHPRLLPGGLRDASADPARVAQWWRRWPAANVGLCTGVVFDVCDVDTPEGLAALQNRTGPLSGLPAVRTGSGGVHLYVAATGVGNRVRLLPGVDWRGVGGYVVAPPSWHASGARYRWVRPLRGDPPACPPALRELLATPVVPAAPVPPPPVRSPHRYAAAALANEAQRVRAAPVGQRNDTLYRAARSLGRLVAAELLGGSQVAAALTEAGLAAGLGELEVTRTIRSALRGPGSAG